MASTFKDRTGQVHAYYDRLTSGGVVKMALDFKKIVRPLTPRRKGGAASLSNPQVRGNGKDTAQVVFNKAYSAYQNRGKRFDGTRVVKRYTTAGTGRRFVQTALEAVKRKKESYFR